MIKRKKILIQKGSLLLEILLAVAIGAIIVGAVAGLVYVSSRSGEVSGTKSAAISLAEEGLGAMQAVAESDWHSVYLPPAGSGLPTDKGESFPYYVYKNGASWAISSNVLNRDIIVNGDTYSRTIYIYNVSRSVTGDREIVASGGADDPSTQKIKVVVSKDNSSDVVLEEYLTRWINDTSNQSDWSGGSGQDDLTDPLKYSSDDGNIDTTSVSGSIKLKAQ